MSQAKRKGFEFTINQIGKALFALEDLLGSTSTPNSVRLDFENNYIRLRGSTIFNDYDLSKKDPLNISASEFNTFNTDEPSDLALQGGSIKVKSDISSFLNPIEWSPNKNSPPSPEGWFIYDYNAWSNYVPKYNSSGLANTALVIYDLYSEPNSGVLRTSFEYPVRFTGFGNTYDRIPLFEHASWISVANLGGSTVDEINLIIPKTYFGGAYNIDPLNDTPIDLLIMSHSYLKSISIDEPITLSDEMGIKGVSDVLEPLAYRVFVTDQDGISFASNSDFYSFNISLPIGYTWSESDYRHFVFYWGSYDSYVDNLKKTYSRSSNTIDIHYPVNLNSSLFMYPKKNFFLKDLKNSFEFEKTGVNDSNVYLYNKNNYLNTYKETKYNIVKQPFRYKLAESIPGSATGITNSLIGFKTIKPKEYISFIIACKNNGFLYDNPEIDLELFSSFPFSIEAIPFDWNNFDFYPDVPENYTIIAKIIAKNSEINYNTSFYINNNSLLNNDLTIVYIDMIPENVLKKSISLPDISLHFSDAFKTLSNIIRKKDYINFFNSIGQKLTLRFSRYNLNKIQNSNQFLSFSSNEYKAMHALLKLPYDSLLKSENEPKSIQFSINGSNLISNFSVIAPCLNFAGFNSTSLYFENFKFKNNNEFEIYLEKNVDEINDQLDNNRGLEKDYAFRIKFSNTLNEFTIKDLFVNASEYYLNEYEFNDRKNKKLTLDGFYSESTINDIEEFKINSYAGLIPDLKLENYRTIINKENSPENSSRTTISQFEEELKNNNPIITKNEIIQSKIGFGLTDAFYVVDNSKPSDLYNGIADLGLSITNYSYNKNKYWIDNCNKQQKINTSAEILPAFDIKDLRLDSFLISKSGFALTDNSINILENINNQRILSSENSSINKTIQLGKVDISYNKIALKIENDQRQEIKSFKIKLKKTSDYINKNAYVKCFLYSDFNNLPYEILASGSSILLKDISENFEDFYFELEYRLYPDKIYWIVLEIPQLPPLYDPYVKGLIDVNDSMITSKYDNNSNTIADFSRYLIGAELGIGSTSVSGITTWYPITSIGSSISMTVSSTGQTLSNQSYSIKYCFELGITESSAIGGTKNLAIFDSSIGWTSQSGTAFIQFYKPDIDIYAAFNRDFSDSNLILPPPNRYRESGLNKVDDFWCFNSKQFFNDQKLYIYPRSLYLKKIDIVGSGVSNNNIISVSKDNYDDSILTGLGLSNSYLYAAGTSITNITYDSNNKKYDIYLSNNLTSSFDNEIIGIGTNQNIFVKRANDIFVILKYKKYSGIAITHVVLEKNPTWIAYWYKSNKLNFKNLNKINPANNVTATYNLNFNNYLYDTYDYVNGYVVGEFYVKPGIGTTFDFRFYSSGGLKVFVNNKSSAEINSWTNTNSMIGYTFSTSIASTQEKIKFEVQFNNSILLSGAGQTLIGQWKISGTQNWNNIDDSFYKDNVLEPVLIDTEDIQSIDFMYCSKNNELFNMPNLGSPVNDRLVIRSK